MIGPDRWARIKRFLIVFKIPITATVISATLLTVHFVGSLPSLPDGSVPFLLSVFFVSIPSYLFAIIFIRWLDPPNPGVRVLEIDAGSDEKAIPHVVPREIWEDREVEGPDPYPLDDGAFLVRDYDWQADIGQLTVTGVWQANASPVELYYERRRIDDMHDWYRVELQKATANLARVNRMGIEMFEGSVEMLSEVFTEGAVPDKDLIGDPIEGAREEVHETSEPPTMEDTLEAQESVSEAAEHAEEMAEAKPDGGQRDE
jgi:hypothetical protein